MRKHNSYLAAAVVFLAALSMRAQVLEPAEVKDSDARQLQTKHMAELRSVAAAADAHHFGYPFYFTRVLDVPESEMPSMDQRSIRFERYKGKMMLMVTANYYVSFASGQVPRDVRVRKVLDQAVRPILQASVAAFKTDDFDGYAFEIAYHVRQKVMGVKSENAENAVFLFSRAAATKVANSSDDEQLQAALLESELFVNADPFTLWVLGNRPSDQELTKRKQAVVEAPKTAGVSPAKNDEGIAPGLLNPAKTPSRLILPQTLSNLKLAYADKIASAVREIGPDAHFVDYAPPEFIAFHEGIYLEFSVKSPIEAGVSGSRYKLAALAFDEHISHLLRPSLAYFQDSNDFDGLVFSTTVSQPGDSSGLAIEFFMPFSQVKCFARYDCSGQQLLDSSMVLINGERATINLQMAEAELSRPGQTTP
jgi:hypothetical protein